MNKLRLFTTIALATTILATPAMSQQQNQRKTLLQVLFPKAHERQVERKRLQRERLLRERQAAGNLPKVKTSKNYTYKLVQRSAITIVPVKLEYALAEQAIEENPATHMDAPASAPDEQVVSRMTSDLIAAGEQPMRAEKHLAKAISDHYSEKQEYLWLYEDGNWNLAAREVIKVLANAGAYGLRPEDYGYDVPELAADADEKAIAAHRIQKEVALTVAMMRYAFDARFGTVNPNLLSGYHDFPEHYKKTPDILAELANYGLPSIKMRRMHPQNSKFLALKETLDELKQEQDDIIDLPAKVLIKPGREAEELPLFVAAIEKRGSNTLRETHAELFASYAGETAYNEALVQLVKDYQKEAGLGADGVIGPKTSQRLAGISSDKKEERIVLAMERLRWLPHEFGSRHVFINQPEYRARYIEGDIEKLSMRVVVGKKSNQTNFFYDEIEHVEYNPYWNVPRSIIINEFLPKSLANPGYLDSKGYEVAGTNGRRISSTAVDWYGMGSYPNVDVRQPPGPRNALGELKIMFPNKHAIYMHDTPAKNLFKRDARAFSHGCIRLHDPRAMAAAVLGSNKKHIANAVATGKNHKEVLRSKVPVYVSYFTAWPQEDGTVKYFSDMYGRDAHLKKAIEATRKDRQKSISS